MKFLNDIISNEENIWNAEGSSIDIIDSSRKTLIVFTIAVIVVVAFNVIIFIIFQFFFFKFFELLNKGKNLFFILSEVKGKKNYFLKQNKKLNNSVSYGLFFSSLFQIILNWTNLKAKRKPIFFSFFFLFLVC